MAWLLVRPHDEDVVLPGEKILYKEFSAGEIIARTPIDAVEDAAEWSRDKLNSEEE